MDLFKKCYQYDTAKKAREGGYYPYFHELTSKQDIVVHMEGKEMIMVGSNNYLGLTSHPEVIQAAVDATLKYGTGVSGSRFLNGTLNLHKELEKELASFLNKEDCTIFSTGFQSNLGIISAIAGRNDLIFSDKENHASIYDGTRLSYAETIRYEHSDMADLEAKLAKAPDNKGKLIITDGVFSMSGDIAKLPEIVALAKKYGARVMVDDAHGMGVTGGGRGTAHEFGMDDEVDLIMSTFSKSFASLGGFIAGDSDVIHFIKHTARALIFSASIPASNAASVLAAIEVIKAEPERADRVNAIGKTIRTELSKMGFNIGNSVTPIVPVIIGEDDLTFRTWKALFDNGVFVNPVISPAVAPGQQLLRTSYMATHTDEQIEKVLHVFEQVGKELAII